MSNEKGGEGFNYTYSSKEQQELRNIRSKYMPPQEDKMEHLRRLDAGVTRKAVTVSVSVGILGALIMGIGMCCCMAWGGSLMIPGIVIGILGIITVCMAYPLKKFITKRERKKIAPEVIRLTDELMK